MLRWSACASGCGSTEAKLFQEALAIWLAAREGDDRVAQYVRGYADHPDDVREARAMVDVMGRGLVERRPTRSRPVTVVVVTRTVRGIPTEVRVGPSEGLPGVGVASADELVMIPRTTLRDRIATLSRGKLDEIDAALRFSLGFEA
ncbi:MAG TPA: type II toxin-antitoxin system PemK/MazF family toxin [Kofleriaceae bacterium]|jgi:mRNA-degrading endonuclease toxin of MazEF toxin-antitoxin module|nr:type II toxin-antitoxin system PemK/MazF family toxin [Kofleriaceae bacterium]